MCIRDRLYGINVLNWLSVTFFQAHHIHRLSLIHILFSMMTNHVNEDLTTEMKNATLPVITLERSEQEVNELYGYHTKMNACLLYTSRCV